MGFYRQDEEDYTRMKLIRGNAENLQIALDHANLMLTYGGQSEQYKDDIIQSLKEILNAKDELIGQLRSEIAELKS